MNEYQKAYYDCLLGKVGDEQWSKIKQLVFRATPMLVDIRYATNNPTSILEKQFCPSCGEMLYDFKPKYCPFCGQALDWKEEEKE